MNLKSVLLAATIAALTSPTPSLAQRYVGECARAGQVAESMNLGQMVQNGDWRGYSMEPAGGACFIISYYVIKYTGGNADEANFTYTSREMIGYPSESYCSIQYRVSEVKGRKKEFYLNGEIKISKRYVKYADGTCSVDLQAAWTRKSPFNSSLNQSFKMNASTWDVYKGKLVSVDFPRFMHLEFY